MLLVAESGSSKTDWAFVEKRVVVARFQTIGINPYLMTNNEIVSLIKHELPYSYLEKVNKLYFYGAGCKAEENKIFLKETFSQQLPNASMLIMDDLLGAAHALCGNKSGVVCILGTGSNAGYYNGKSITNRITSLGFILGDQGSGVAIGKILLTEFLLKKMPDELMVSFAREYPGNLSDFLANIYKKSFPNRYIASFAKFCYLHKSHPYIVGILRKVFDEFCSTILSELNLEKDTPINFIGSIAFYFKDSLSISLSEFSMKLGEVEASPSERLIKYIQLTEEGCDLN